MATDTNTNTNTKERQERVETGIVPTQDQINAVRKLLDQITARDAANETPGAAAVTAPVTTQRRKRRNDMSTVLQAVPQPTNAPTFTELLAAVTDLGEQAGKGKDVQIKFDLKVMEAAYAGSLSLDANKHGKDADDATKLSEAYWKAQQGAVVFDAKADNQRKTISTTRKMIKLGSCPKWGVGEPMGRVNDLMTMRQSLKKKNQKVDDAHNTLMRFATAQLKLDTLMDDNMLQTFCLKRVVEARTAEEVLEALRKTANNLKEGKVSNCPDMDSSAEVQSIINACTKRLAAIAKARGPQGGTTTP